MTQPLHIRDSNELTPLLERLGVTDVCVARGLFSRGEYHSANSAEALQLLHGWNSAGWITGVAVQPTSLQALRLIVADASRSEDSMHRLRKLMAWTYKHYLVTTADGRSLELVVPIHNMEG
jgi:tRNA-dihydrouridine synthase